jgi:predicted O-methyltransferase YrrM
MNFSFLSKLRNPRLRKVNVQESFKSLGFNLESAATAKKLIFQEMKMPLSPTSLHFEIVAAINEQYRPLNILEIGTHDGYFSRYLSILFPKAVITTVELPFTDSGTKVANAHRIQKQNYGNNEDIRSYNIDDLSNVNQIFSDSTLLTFNTSQYDLIWVDGDHTFPVVAFDIINAIRMISSNGWILVDDIRVTNTSKKSVMGYDEGYVSIKHLEELGVVEVTLIPKHLNRSEKFIAVLRRKNA